MQVGNSRQRFLNSNRSRTIGRLALATFFLFFGNKGLQNAVAEGDTRTISLHHTHTAEDITVTFKRNGRYDEEALKKLNHFLRDWRVDESTRMEPRLFDLIWEVYREVGGREPVQIVSAYRSPHTNAMLRRRSRGVAQYSQHTVGHAMDFFIPGVALADVRAAGLRLQRGGVGFYPTSGSPFVHLDTGGVRHWPRMNRDQLAKIFPDGRTVHVPSDGHPLSGYAVALADVERRGGSPSSVSLAAARGAGIAVGSEGGAERPRRGGTLARLFGFGAEEDEETEVAPARNPASVVSAQSRQEIASIPVPPARPARQGEYRLASAQTSPADVISARGNWRGEVTLPAPDSDALKRTIEESAVFAPERFAPGSGQLLAWNSGPQGRQFTPDAPMPRPRRHGDTPLAETTASARPLQMASAGTDRIPSDLVLAYAANPDSSSVGRAVSPPAPVARPNAATSRKQTPLPPVKVGQRNDDPWLRGIIMTPSVERSLRVTLLGEPDYRQLSPLMAKPRLSIAMVFSRDPHLGMTSAKFTGGAIAFLPTVTFIRTASLF